MVTTWIFTGSSTFLMVNSLVTMALGTTAGFAYRQALRHCIKPGQAFGNSNLIGVRCDWRMGRFCALSKTQISLLILYPTRTA